MDTKKTTKKKQPVDLESVMRLMTKYGALEVSIGEVTVKMPVALKIDPKAAAGQNKLNNIDDQEDEEAILYHSA